MTTKRKNDDEAEQPTPIKRRKSVRYNVPSNDDLCELTLGEIYAKGVSREYISQRAQDFADLLESILTNPLVTNQALLLGNPTVHPNSKHVYKLNVTFRSTKLNYVQASVDAAFQRFVSKQSPAVFKPKYEWSSLNDQMDFVFKDVAAKHNLASLAYESKKDGDHLHHNLVIVFNKIQAE